MHVKDTAMEQLSDYEYMECKIRLDAAVDLLTLSSSLLRDVILSGQDEPVDSALAILRLARVRFLVARDEYREATDAVLDVPFP
jgi:hypothetical protein